METQDDELLKDFVIESQEHLCNVENELLELESTTTNVDVHKVNVVFRAIHSIKGVAGFLNLKTIESLAHREEEVLNKLRNLDMRPTSEVINTLLRASDCLKSLLDDVENSNSQDVSVHTTALEKLLRNASTESDLDTQIQMEDIQSAELQTDQVAADAGQSNPPSANSGTSELLREFIIETNDNLEQLETHLIALEQSPLDESLIHSVFRTIHTIKGSSGFIGFKRIEAVSHAAENLLSDVRAGKRVLGPDANRSLFDAIDFLRKQLAEIENTQSESDASDVEIIAALNSRHPQAEVASDITVVTSAVASTTRTERLGAQHTKTVSSSPIAEKSTDTHAPSHTADSTIRVDVALLDKLMNRVGELVLARNQILQFSNSFGNCDLLTASQHLNLITSELQEEVMKTRMQPIGNVWAKFPRLVRDLAEICGKSVRIEMIGKETELDKTIIEAIKDPLTHLVRNTVDHGIEAAEVRLANGKQAEGCLCLRAYHEGGQVNIEISDDGGGLNLSRIKSKAVEKGLVSPEQAARLSDRETGNLIFLPGFSTAEKVSNVSGRGVGMDVVKTNIEKIGGTVELDTVAGKGTSIKIKIPLTLAIIPALLVTSHGNRFAIPQVNLLELVRLETLPGRPGIEWIHGAPVYRLRGRLLPLVYLREVLKPKKNTAAPTDCVNIVVLRVEDRQFGLVVDRINDTEEIVVKPLGKQLKAVTVFSGATIMGDGKVALILDVLGLAHTAQVLSKNPQSSLLESSYHESEAIAVSQTLLILGTGSNRRLALPISQVARLEKIPSSTVEYTDNMEVVQYRGQILPLIRLAAVLGLEESEPSKDGVLNVVVYIENNCCYGLVVNRIIDIVETTLENTRPCQKDGLLGSSIIHGHVTVLVDLPAIIRQLNIVPRMLMQGCS